MIEFQLSYSRSWKMMLWKVLHTICTQYAICQLPAFKFLEWPPPQKTRLPLPISELISSFENTLVELGKVLRRNQIQMLNRWVDKWGHCYQFNPHMGQLVSHREELCSKATDCTINPSQPSPNCVSLITRGPGMSVNSSEQTHHHLWEQSRSVILHVLHLIGEGILQ